MALLFWCLALLLVGWCRGGLLPRGKQGGTENWAVGLSENPIVCKTTAPNDGNGFVFTYCYAWPVLCPRGRLACQKDDLIERAFDRSVKIPLTGTKLGDTVPAGFFTIIRDGGLAPASDGPAFWIFECAPGTYNEFDMTMYALRNSLGTTNDGALCGVAQVDGCSSHEVEELSRCTTCPYGYDHTYTMGGKFTGASSICDCAKVVNGERTFFPGFEKPDEADILSNIFGNIFEPQPCPPRQGASMAAPALDPTPPRGITAGKGSSGGALAHVSVCAAWAAATAAAAATLWAGRA